MTQTDEADTSLPKLNILQLPSYTAVLFGLIAFVVLGAALASVLPHSRLWWPPVVIGLTLLPLRDFLRRPDDEIRRQGLAAGDPETPDILSRELKALAPGKVPALLISDRRVGAYAFGSFRRWYIGVGATVAARMTEALETPDEKKRQPQRTVLAHELAHFYNGDVSLIWLGYAFLKMQLLVAVVSLWIAIVLIVFVTEISPEILQPAFWQNLSAAYSAMLPGMSIDLTWMLDSLTHDHAGLVAQLLDPSQRMGVLTSSLFYQISAFLPFILSGVILYSVYWRSLLRTRELYADLRAAEFVGDSKIILPALALHWTTANLSLDAPSRKDRLLDLLTLPGRIPLLGRLFAAHPSNAERRLCLEKPWLVFGSWPKIAALAGLAVVLLDLTLRGTLTAAYISEPGAYLPFLAGFIIFTVWLLPRICLGQPKSARLWPETAWIILLFTAIVLLPRLLDLALATFMMLTNPERWGSLIDLWIYGMVGAPITGTLPPLMGQVLSWPEFIELHVLRPIAYLALVMPPVMLGFLWLDTRLKRRVLTWYGLETRLKRAFWGITGVLATILAFIVIPICNRLLFPKIYDGWSLPALFGVAAALLALLAGCIAYVALDRRLSHRCPACNGIISDPFRLGNTCTRCGHVLHEWLHFNY